MRYSLLRLRLHAISPDFVVISISATAHRPHSAAIILCLYYTLRRTLLISESLFVTLMPFRRESDFERADECDDFDADMMVFISAATDAI